MRQDVKDIMDRINAVGGKAIEKMELLADEIVSHPPRILSCDDDAVMLKLIKRALGPHGYEIDTVTDAEEAVDKVNSGDYGLAILDIHMPKRDGFWILDQIRKHHITKLLLTGIYVTPELEEKAASFGAFVLQKDSMSDLIDKVIQVLPPNSVDNTTQI